MVKSAVVLSEIKENLKDSRFTPALSNHLRNQKSDIILSLCYAAMVISMLKHESTVWSRK